MSNLFVANSRHWQPNGLYLMYEVVGRHQQVLYDVGVMPIYDHESDLDKGRFKHFVREPQENAISLDLMNTRETEMVVGWIAENVETPWNLDYDMKTVTEGTMIFSFADPKDALVFKMVFA